MTAPVAAWLPCIACGSVIKREQSGPRVSLGHVGPFEPACSWLGEALLSGDVVLEPLADADLRRRLARPR